MESAALVGLWIGLGLLALVALLWLHYILGDKGR